MTLKDYLVAEAVDLDFKSELYGNSDKAKHDAATDVAALANTAGGLLILGMAEDKQARAVAAPGVSIAEEEERRLRQIIGSRVMPFPVHDFLRIEDPAQPGHGLILIAVPRSPLGPHAVLVNEGLRYPRRNGATIRYLSEPEVAAAYRERFASAGRQVDRAQEIEADALQRLDTSADSLWVVVSLVPDLTGELLIDQAALRHVERELVDQSPLIMPSSLGWRRVSIGRRRLLVDGTMRHDSPTARWLSADLHSDGAGAFGSLVLLHQQPPPPVDDNPAGPKIRLVHDESVINGILSALRFLGRHARDRAAAGGNALIRAQLYPTGPEWPLRLACTRSGFIDSLGTNTLVTSPPPGERVAPLESLASDGPDLVSAAYLLATDIFQAFGFAEASQLTRDGRVRIRYWGHEWQQAARNWAETAGIDITEEH